MKMSGRLRWGIAAAILGLVGCIAGFAALLVLGIFHMMDATDAHRCGLAAVQKGAAAVRLVGTPIVQSGFTGGRSKSANGELWEHITFNVTGPKGTAFVLSEGRRSPVQSQLTVTIGRNGQGETVYDGPFDCPELHAK